VVEVAISVLDVLPERRFTDQQAFYKIESLLPAVFSRKQVLPQSLEAL
jgi:hypothetical protein